MARCKSWQGCVVHINYGRIHHLQFISFLLLLYRRILSTDAFTVNCEDFANFDDGSFGCTLASTIISWMLVAVLLVLLGFVVFVPLAIGNHPTDRRLCKYFSG